MKKQIICLSGWGQKFNSLEYIFKSSNFSNYSIISLNYSAFNSLENFFTDVENSNLNPEILIGWSLGGQLAIRLIERKILSPKLLILIAPPFQMVKDEKIQAGMSQAAFKEFYENFKKAPKTILKKFAILMAMNDKNASEIAKNLDINDDNFQQLIFWLEELVRFSCFDVDFSNMPKTLYFHGAGDMIVSVLQMDYFKKNIKDFQGLVFKNCGHAPHLNNVEKCREEIYSIIKNIP